MDVILDDRCERPGVMFAGLGAHWRCRTASPLAIARPQEVRSNTSTAATPAPPRWRWPMSWPMSWAVWPHDAGHCPALTGAGRVWPLPPGWRCQGWRACGRADRKPLMDSVRTALVRPLPTRAARPQFPTTEARMHYLRWMGAMSNRLRRRRARPEVRREFLQTVVRKQACGSGRVAGARVGAGRKCVSQVCRLPVRARLCRSCRFGRA